MPQSGLIDDPVATRPRTAESESITGISVPGNRGVKISRSCTILRPTHDLYAFWRNIENLALIIRHPASISRISEVEHHWSVSAPPGDSRVEWVSVIINDHPNELIAWRSREGAEVPNAGSVRFEKAPGDEGTEVTVTLEYNPPGGKLGAWLAKLSGEEPGQQVSDALGRFKALMETGEIPTIEGQPVGEPQLSRRAKK